MGAGKLQLRLHALKRKCHSIVVVPQVDTGNWTSVVNGLHEEGTTQLIAHFKIASFQLALRKDIKVNPKTGQPQTSLGTKRTVVNLC